MNRSIRLAVSALTVLMGITPAIAETQQKTFNLKPEQSTFACLAKEGASPTAQVFVERGPENDLMVLRAHGLKPNKDFDVFTVQNSNLLSNGLLDASFKNFGMAWYQSDLHSDANGEAEVVIKTILFDQIFGFDPAFALPPTNTFHVGFWFNNPKDAAACGFDATKPTPFNGEHKAGPAAMISVPDAVTHLGPLCTKPVSSGSGWVCNP